MRNLSDDRVKGVQLLGKIRNLKPFGNLIPRDGNGICSLINNAQILRSFFERIIGPEIDDRWNIQSTRKELGDTLHVSKAIRRVTDLIDILILAIRLY